MFQHFSPALLLKCWKCNSIKTLSFLWTPFTGLLAKTSVFGMIICDLPIPPFTTKSPRFCSTQRSLLIKVRVFERIMTWVSIHTFLALVAWGLFGERERELLVPALSSPRGFARVFSFFSSIAKKTSSYVRYFFWCFEIEKFQAVSYDVKKFHSYMYLLTGIMQTSNKKVVWCLQWKVSGSV